MKNRLLPTLLVVCMIVALLPQTSWAATTTSTGEPTLIGLMVRTSDGETVSILDNAPTTDLSLAKPYIFTAEFSHANEIKDVYITSTDNGEKKFLETHYDEQSGMFVSNGYFDDDENFEPGGIQVEYTPKRPEVYVTDSVDWDALAFSGIGTEQITVNAQSATSINSTIDVTELIEDELEHLIDVGIETFDASTGSDLDTFLGAYKDLDKLLSYVVEGKDKSRYIVYLDLKDKKTGAMIVNDLTGNKYIKMILSSDENLDSLSNSIAKVNTVSNIVYNYYSIQEDMDKLRDKINVSIPDLSKRNEALNKVDNLEDDKISFSLISTVLPLVAATFSVSSAPAILFSAFLGVIKTSADYFWDNRIGMIQSEMIYINTGNLVDTGVCGADGDNLVWTLDRQGTLRISGTGRMRDYPGAMYPSWRQYMELIRTIILEPGITSVGDGVFSNKTFGSEIRGYSSLTGSLIIPDTVISIGEKAFSGRSEFNGTLTLSTNLETVGFGAFNGCSGFTGSLDIPNTVINIEQGAFNGCSGFNGSLTISNNVETIGMHAFYGCNNFQGALVIPDSVKEIGSSAFYCFGGSSKFSGIVLGNNVETIKSKAFGGISISSPLFIPASVKIIESGAFDDYNQSGPKTEIFFEGDAPDIVGIGTGYETSFPKPYSFHDIVFRYIPGTSGWTESEFYNSEKGTWKGYTLLPWGEDTCKHEYTSTVTEPTCIKQGYTTYICTKCNDSYTDSYTSALGHSYGAWIIIIQATESTNGQQERICSRCGNKETSIIPATGSGSSSSGDNSGNSSSSGGASSSGDSTSQPIISVTTNTNTENGISTTETTASPTASISSGKASTTINTSIGNEIVKQIKSNNSESLLIVPQISREVTKTEVSIPTAIVNQIGSQTSASLTVSTPVANVTIPNGGLSSLSNAGGTVTITTEKTGDTVELTVTSDGRSVEHIPGRVTLTVPASNTNPGTVAVLIHKDGTREVVRKSVAGKDSIMIPLDGSAKLEIVDNSKPFSDVPADNWAANAIAFVSAHELFNGTGLGKFSPNLPMSRGMLAVVLHNLESNPEQVLTGVFGDVDNGMWYAKGVTWAASNDIVSGYGDGRFGPNDNITREQLAVMLWRYAGSPAATNKELNFADADKASGYALNALCWAVENGIINGYGNGQLGPQGLATRAQVAQMLKNYMKR